MVGMGHMDAYAYAKSRFSDIIVRIRDDNVENNEAWKKHTHTALIAFCIERYDVKCEKKQDKENKSVKNLHSSLWGPRWMMVNPNQSKRRREKKTQKTRNSKQKNDAHHLHMTIYIEFDIKKRVLYFIAWFQLRCWSHVWAAFQQYVRCYKGGRVFSGMVSFSFFLVALHCARVPCYLYYIVL